MSYRSAAVVFVGVKHKNHDEIIGKLVESRSSVIEIDVPNGEAVCSKDDYLDQIIPTVELLVVYLSKEVKDNACVTSAVLVARRKNIKIVAIWLGEEKQSDVGEAVGNNADCVIPYSEKGIDAFLSGSEPIWENADGSTLDKRKITKHTCG